MTRIAIVLVFCGLMTACGPKESDRVDAATDAGAQTNNVDDTDAVEAGLDASVALKALVDEYFEENLELNPLFGVFIGDYRYNDRLENSLGKDHRDKSLAMEKQYLDALIEIDPSGLDGQDRLSYEVFKLDRESAIEGARYPSHLVPINQMFSLPNFMPVLGSGKSAQPFATVEDYDNFLIRLDGFVVISDQAIANMREGIEEGIVQPRVVMEKVLPQITTHIVENAEDSVFYQPIANMPDDFSDADRTRLTEAYTAAITDEIIPVYTRLAEFIENDYLPVTRETVGVSDLPGGKDWYAYLVLTNTTIAMDPMEIHQIGLDEVTRIRSEMEDVMEQVGFDGELSEFFEFVRTDDQFYFEQEEDLVNGYMELKEVINAKLPELFSDFPKADYEVRPVEEFRAASSAGASYQSGTPDGARPGIFYINTHNLRAQPKYGMETLSLHEASPGHHFQISIQQELDDLPKFRRFGGYTAYAEGWALYAESIGTELGMFTEPYQYYGKLNDEQLRAMRLVVDTGLHARGWSRQQAIDFMLENSSMAESDVIAEVERYIAIPGQALAYKVGQINIRRMRDKAEAELGDKFDIRAWHSQILRGGALPLAVLEARNDRWIERQKG